MSLERPVKKSQSKTQSPIQRNNAKTVSARSLLKSHKDKDGEEKTTERPSKFAFIGDAGSGKTTKILQLLHMLATDYHLKPEQIRIEMIDLDSGLAELLEQALVPEEYLDSIGYSLCSNFIEVSEMTQQAFERLHEHKQKHGLAGTWIVVDNMMKAWQYPQDDYCRAVYGMSLVEKMKQARKTQEIAKAQGKKGEGVFKQNLDWGTITPMHNDWAEAFTTCGFNFMWLSPWKQEDIKDAEDNVIGQRDRWGQRGNELRVSHIIKLYTNAQGKRMAEFTKSRTTKTLPKNIRDTSLRNLLAELHKIEDIEKREKEAEMKKYKFASEQTEEIDKTQEEKPALNW